jgi:hypothetical protein
MTKPPPALRDMVGYHDLMADLKKHGCPVCHGADRSAWKMLDGLLWESVNDPGIRARLRATHGFCRSHALMALSVASEQSAALGMAILYEDFLRNVREEVIQATAPRQRRQRRGLPRIGQPCMICHNADSTARNYLGVLAKAAEDTDPWRAIRRPERGLCLPHVTLGLRLHTANDEAANIAEAFLHGEAELRRNLQELIRKHDYRFMPEGFTEEERASWVRAVHRLVGNPPPRRRPER